MSTVLRDAGYEVRTASNGVQALAAARARTPDLVVSDLMLPQLDGAGLAQELHQDPALRAVPFVLMSAVPGPHRGLSPVAFLHKPFDLDDLVATVLRCLVAVADQPSRE